MRQLRANNAFDVPALTCPCCAARQLSRGSQGDVDNQATSVGANDGTMTFGPPGMPHTLHLVQMLVSIR